MNRFSSIFSQLLQFFPRVEFQQLVAKTQAERHSKGFSCWSQFVSMLFCQLGRAHSLREISGELRSCEGKLRHLGITAPSHSTLAYANEHRPWNLYQEVFRKLFDRCRVQIQMGKKKFRFKNRLIGMDSSLIDLCLEMFDWAHFRRTKGAIKLHLLLGHDGYLPSFAVITEGRVLDVSARGGSALGGKALKQNLKIKTFVGTSANAVKIQIWAALIAMLILRFLQLRSQFNWSLSNLVALLRMNLFTYRVSGPGSINLLKYLRFPMNRNSFNSVSIDLDSILRR